MVSLALGLFQDFGPGRTPGEPPVDWVEGVAIMIAVLIVVSIYIVINVQHVSNILIGGRWIPQRLAKRTPVPGP